MQINTQVEGRIHTYAPVERETERGRREGGEVETGE